MAKSKHMIHIVTFADDRMSKSAGNLLASSKKHGVEHGGYYKPESLPGLFKALAMPAISESKGAGMWIWKPFIIWQYMNIEHHVKDGDIIIYADAGQTIVESVKPVIEAMDQDIMFFSNGWPHVEWCKADVINAIVPELAKEDDFSGDIYWDDRYKQVQASLIFFKITPETRNFVKEWMLWCLMPGFCDDSPSKLQNCPTFADTRHDQSVVTCLQIKYGYKLHWLPVLTAMHIKAEYPNDNYPAISDFHRKRNHEW